jgi:hypothetical protein
MGPPPVTQAPAVAVPVAPVVVPPPEGKVVRPPETTGTKFARALLVLIGLALIAGSVGGVVAGRIWGNETKETSTPSGPSGATGATGATGSSGAATTTKKTTTKDFGSDELLTAAFATGAALIAFGLLLSRISVLKLPGGIELQTTKEEAEKVKEEVKKQVENGQVDASKAPDVTVAALENVRDQKRAEFGTSGLGNPTWDSATGALGSTLSDEKIVESVNTAAAEHGREPDQP